MNDAPGGWHRSSHRKVLGISLGTLLVTLFCCPLLSPDLLPLRVWWSSPLDVVNGDAFTFWQLRLPRALMAVLAGATLATAGAGFQALLRNPLATPYTLGVASGASLGAVASLLLGIPLMVPLGLGMTGAAVSGAAVSIFIVYWFGRRSAGGVGLPSTTLILAGVTLNYFWGSMVLFLQCLADPMQLYRMIRWTIGGLEDRGFMPILRVLPFSLLLIGVMLRRAGELNLLAAGDEWAASRGVEVRSCRRAIFLAASLATGVLVAETGPIGFVGLIVPHGIRLVAGPDHRLLIPATALLGGAFLCICDTLARSLSMGLPVGVLTALLGGPFFLILLSWRKHASSAISAL